MDDGRGARTPSGGYLGGNQRRWRQPDDDDDDDAIWAVDSMATVGQAQGVGES